MAINLFSSAALMAAYFLILYAGDGLIQGKRFFSSAPQENFSVLPDHKPERFRGAHLLGWLLAALAIALFAGAFVLAGWDGVQKGFSFGAFFGRFVIMLYALEVYDIFFFDWFLLCRSDFFAHFYPEVKGRVGPAQFGYNKKAHLCHFALYLPASAILAWVCTLL